VEYVKNMLKYSSISPSQLYHNDVIDLSFFCTR